MKRGMAFSLLTLFCVITTITLLGCGGEEVTETDKTSVKTPAGGTKESAALNEELKEVQPVLDPKVKAALGRLNWKRKSNMDAVAEAALTLADLKDKPDLAEQVKTAIPKLRELLKSPNAFVRSSVARAIGKIAGKDATRDLEILLQTEEEVEQVKLEALEALNKMNDIGNMNLFISCIEDDSPKVAGAAIRALTRLNAEGSAATIHETIQFASDGELIRAGLEALVKFKYTENAKDIAHFMRFENEGVRMEAAKSFARLKPKSVRVLGELLTAMEEDDIPTVRKYAFEAFKSITGQKMVFNYEEVDEETRVEEVLGFHEWLEKNKKLFRE